MTPTAPNTSRLRELLAAATPGKWERYGIIGQSGLKHVRYASHQDRTGRTIYRDVLPDERNAEFIAEAKNALPALLDAADAYASALARAEAAERRALAMERLYREARGDQFEPKANQLAWRPAFDAETERRIEEAGR